MPPLSKATEKELSEGSLRADAERNRQSILVAAEALFLERGAGAVSYTHLRAHET